MEKMVNSRVVRKLFKYYGGHGSKRINELFVKDREKSPDALLGRFPIRLLLNKNLMD